jgi:hypothetical protein
MRVGLVVALGAALLLASSAAASPARDAVVRPGVSVGKIRLGMSEAQLRRAMGRPAYVAGRTKVFGGVRVEYQFGIDADYTVELRGRPGALRVVEVSTSLRSQRLPNGLGVGSRVRALRAAYRDRLRCTPFPTFTDRGGTRIHGTSTCRLGTATGATLFLLKLDEGVILPSESNRASVFVIGVETAR